MTELVTAFFGGYAEGTRYLCALLKSEPRFIAQAGLVRFQEDRKRGCCQNRNCIQGRNRGRERNPESRELVRQVRWSILFPAGNLRLGRRVA